jgi:5-(aminomethyl)-3-furanmethanol phosphate kinase
VKRSGVTVIKVGGSLFDWPEIPRRIAEIVENRRAVDSSERYVLIAGGGPAVDVIRDLDGAHHLGEPIAHRLALCAMDLTAVVLAELLPGALAAQSLEALTTAWSAGAIPVLAPRLVLAEIERAGGDPLHESWDVTSDSIAARVAVHLEADCLVLLKSADFPAVETRAQAARLGLVDPMFPIVARPLRRVEYLNLRKLGAEPRLLT